MSDTMTADADHDLTEYLRECWRIGDALAAAECSGVPYRPVPIPPGLSPEAALEVLVADARWFVEYVHQCVTAR
jgi:hypothetical protein